MRLTQYLRSAALSEPEQTALVVDGQERTYAQLYRRALRSCEHLLCEGLMKRDVVAVFAGDRASTLELLYGTLMAGGVFAPLNPRWEAPTLARVLDRLGPVLVYADLDHIETAREAVGSAGIEAEVRLLEALENMPASQDGNGASARFEDDRWSRERESAGEEPALIVHTTGTGGRPKPVVHSHRSLLGSAFAELCALRLHLSAFVTTGGFYLSATLVFFLESTICRGRFVCQGASDAERYLDTVERTRPVAARLTPAMSEAPFELFDLSSVKLWIQGGYQLRQEHLRGFLERLGGAVAHGYGTTEALGVSTLLPEDYRYTGDHLFTAGKPWPGVAIRVDPHGVPGSAPELPDERTGLVLVNSPSLASGYYGDPDLTARRFRDGWYNTGDLGFLDESGYLRLVAREAVDEHESAVWLPQIEVMICDYPGVKDSKVISRRGRLVAFVEAREPRPSGNRIRNFLRRHLESASHVPQEFVMTSHLPRDERGRVCNDLLETLPGGA